METTSHIVDQHGRIHDYLRISLTDRCNLRCFYCMPEEGVELTERANLMSIEEIIDIAKVFVSMGVKKIRFTGGEPLIRKNIEKLFTEIAKLGVELAITTNGIVLDKYIPLLKACGFKNINISLDTLEKEKSIFITKRDYFDRIMKNIDAAVETGFDVKLNVVLMKGVNDGEIIDFIELTRFRNLAIKFIEFMPFKDNQWDWSKGVSQDEVLDKVQDYYKIADKLEDPIHSTSRNYKIPEYTGSFGMISTVTNPFCDSCNRIRLTANGRIKNCLFSDAETDILTPFRDGKALDQIIKDAISVKHASRGGLTSFADFADPELNTKNRAMVAIGG